MIHGFLIFIGVTNPSGRAYLWWSGIGSDLGEFAIFGLVYRRLVCHQRGCFRLGHHSIDGSPLIVCRKHHPEL